jgi:hypothetical protein
VSVAPYYRGRTVGAGRYRGKPRFGGAFAMEDAMPKSVQVLEADLRQLQNVQLDMMSGQALKIIAETLVAILAEMQAAKKK